MWGLLICEQQVLSRLDNVTSILICEQQVLSRLNTEYQKIIIMHIDTRYKWKPIREKTTSYFCCDAKASSNSLSPLIFCRHQPTGGYYLNSASYNLQGSSNSPLFFCWLQPTGGSYLSQLQLISIKLQLDMEAPTPIYFLQATTYKRLLPQFCKLQLAREL